MRNRFGKMMVMMCCILSVTLSFEGSKVSAENEGKTADIYIIAGQSNAAGCSVIPEGTPNPSYKNVLYYGSTDRNPKSPGARNYTLEPVRNYMGTGNSKSGFEVGLAEILNKQPRYQKDEVKAVVLRSAAGATSVLGHNTHGSWYPPTLLERDFPDRDYTVGGENYDDLDGYQYRMFVEEVTNGVAKLKSEGFTEINVNGIFWMQGEADRGITSDYKKILPIMISDMREDITEITGKDYSRLPFYIGEISKTFGSANEDDLALNERMIRAQNVIAGTMPNVYVASISHYAINAVNDDGSSRIVGSDQWHWNYEDICSIGRDFATLFLNTGYGYDDGQLLDQYVQVSVEEDSSCVFRFTGENRGNYNADTKKITFEVESAVEEKIVDIIVENGKVKRVGTIYNEVNQELDSFSIPPIYQYEITDISGKIKLSAKTEKNTSYKVNITCEDSTYGMTPSEAYVKPWYTGCRYELQAMPIEGGAVKEILINGKTIKGAVDKKIFMLENPETYLDGKDEINIEIVYDSVENVEEYLKSDNSLILPIIIGGVMIVALGVSIAIVVSKKRKRAKEVQNEISN